MGSVFGYVDGIRKKLSELAGKGWVLRKINGALGELAEPIKEEEIEYDVIRGVAEVRNIVLKPQRIDGAGVTITKGKIERASARIFWYNLGVPVEVEISKVEIEVEEPVCICEDFPERRRAGDVAEAESGGLRKRVLKGLFNKLRSNATCLVKELQVRAKTEKRHEIKIEKIEIGSDKERSEHRIEISNTEVEMCGVRAKGVFFKGTVHGEKATIYADAESVVLDGAAVNRETVRRIGKMTGKIGGGEIADKEEGVSEETEKTGAYEVSVFVKSIPVDVVGVAWGEGISIRAKSTHARITSLKSEIKTEIMVQEGQVEALEVSGGVVEVIRTKNRGPTVYVKMDGVRGRVKEQYFRRAEEGARWFREVAQSRGEGEQPNEKELAQRPNVYVSGKSAEIETEIAGTEAKISLSDCEIHYSDQIKATADVEVQVAHIGVENGKPVVGSGQVSLTKQKDKPAVISACKLETREAIAHVASVAKKAAQEIADFSRIGKSKGAEEEAAHSAANSEVFLQVASLDLSARMSGEKVGVVVQNAKIGPKDVHAQRIRVLHKEAEIAAASPVEIVLDKEDGATFILTNGEVSVPDDVTVTEIVKALIGEFSDNRGSIEEVNSGEIGDMRSSGANSNEGLAGNEEEAGKECAEIKEPENSEKQRLEKISMSGGVRISVSNSRINMKHRGALYSLLVETLGAERIENTLHAHFLGYVEAETEKLEISGTNIAYQQDERQISGEMEIKGDFSAELHAALINRTFFALDCYGLLTENALPAEKPLEIRIDLKNKVNLKKNRELLAEATGNAAISMTKGEGYCGSMEVTQIKVWNDEETLADIEHLRVEFSRDPEAPLKLNVSSPVVRISDSFGFFIDLQSHYLNADYRSSQSTEDKNTQNIGDKAEIAAESRADTKALSAEEAGKVESKIKIDLVEISGFEKTAIHLTDIVAISGYAQMDLSVTAGESSVVSKTRITIRSEKEEVSGAQDKNEITVSLPSVHAAIEETSQISALQNALKQIDRKRVPRFPVPSTIVSKIICGKLVLTFNHPPVQVEALQILVSIADAIEAFALVRVYGQNRETLEYEILCEQFPIEGRFQGSVPAEREKVKFYSLPFSEHGEEFLLVSFLSLTVKETVRVRLSAQMIDVLRAPTRQLKFTNITNKILKIGKQEIYPNSSGRLRDNVCIQEHETGELLFTTYPRNTTSIKNAGQNTYISIVKEDTVVVKGCTVFKNMTDSTLTIATDSDPVQIFLLPFSEFSITSQTLSLRVGVDQHKNEKPLQLVFKLPEHREESAQIELVEKRRIELNDSYMTVMCLLERHSAGRVVHFLFYHEFIITNLTCAPLRFEMKIVQDAKTERITGTAAQGEIKQMSGSAEVAKKRKARLKINGEVEMHLNEGEPASPEGVSRGVYAQREVKNVLVHGHLLNIGIEMVTVYPALVVYNNTDDRIGIRTGSGEVGVEPKTTTELHVSKDKHQLTYEKRSSSHFSSKIVSNTIFADIREKDRGKAQRNYLVNVVQGEGAKEKIKYIVVDYANVVENRTGIELTIIAGREFFCGSGNPVPIHLPRKRVSTWIRLGRPEGDDSEEWSSSSVEEHAREVEDVGGGYYLPLEGLKKHLVKLGDSQPLLLSVTVHVRNSQRVVIIEKESAWPYVVKNATGAQVRFSQKGHDKKYAVEAGEEVPYYWDSFKAQAAFEIEVGNEHLVVKDFAGVGSEKYRAALSSEGDRKVLTVSEVGKEHVQDAVLLVQGACSQINISRVSVSLLDREEQEFACAHLLEIFFASFISQNGIEFLLKVKGLQVDNQEVISHYPIPVHTPGNAGAVSFSGWVVNRTTIRYLNAAVFPLVVAVEEVHARKIAEHFVSFEDHAENPKYFVRCMKCESLRCTCTFPKYTAKSSGYVSIGYVRIEPVKFSLSFKRATEHSIVPLSSLVCNITNSKILLPEISLKDIHAKDTEILQLIEKTYKKGLLKNIVSLVLSADIVGSPGELIDKLGVSVHDLISAPYRAIDNPALLSKQLLSGGKSLAKNVVTGVVDLVGNITGKLSHQLASISMDEKFAERFQETRCIYVDEVEMVLPTTKTHLSKAGEKFMGSVISGFKGVVHSPIQGTKSHGLSGMVQGIGKGLVGAVFKPISGVMGLAQGVTTTISDAIQGEKPLLRIQLPRAPPLGAKPSEYEVERNKYYRAYACIAGGARKGEKYLTGGACAEKYIGWFAVITNVRTIFYSKDDVFEIQGQPVVEIMENSTLLNVNGNFVMLEGARVYEEIEKVEGLGG